MTGIEGHNDDYDPFREDLVKYMAIRRSRKISRREKRHRTSQKRQAINKTCRTEGHAVSVRRPRSGSVACAVRIQEISGSQDSDTGLRDP